MRSAKTLVFLFLLGLLSPLVVFEQVFAELVRLEIQNEDLNASFKEKSKEMLYTNKAFRDHKLYKTIELTRNKPQNSNRLLKNEITDGYLVFELSNRSRHTIKKILNIGRSHYSMLYKIDQNGAVQQFKSGLVFPTRLKQNSMFIDNFEIELGSQESAIYVLQFYKTLLPYIEFFDLEEFELESKITKRFALIYYGAVIALFLYNLFLYLILREKKYLWYIGILFSQHIIYCAHNHGFVGKFLGEISAAVFHFALSFMVIGYLFFLDEVAGLKKYFPQTFKILTFCGGSIAIGSIINLTHLYQLGFQIISFSFTKALVIYPAILYSLLILFMFFWGSLVKNDKSCKLVSLAWSPFAFLMLLHIFGSEGVIEEGFWAKNSMVIGSLFEGIFLSFVLAFQTKELKDSLLSSEKTMRGRLGSIVQASKLADIKGNIDSEITKIINYIRKEIPALENSKMEYLNSPSEVLDDSPSQISFPVKLEQKCIGRLLIRGNEDISLSKDQKLYIENLMLVFGKVIEGIEFVKTESEKSKFKGELESAKLMQEALLSMRTNLDGLDSSFYYQPAELTGGDWVGKFFDSEKQIVYFCCGDVTGHGLAAAFVTAVAAGALEGFFSKVFQNRSRQDHPKEICHEALLAAHYAISHTGAKFGRLMTMQIVAINIADGMGIVANAAHNPAMIHTKEKVRFINIPSMRLGGNEENVKIGIKEFQLKKGDSLMLFTDGLLENKGSKGGVVTKRNLQKILSGKEFCSKKLLKAVLKYGQSIWCDYPPEDDCAVITYTHH